MAGAVRRGEVSAAELVEAAIGRIERVDPELRAVVVRLFDEARAAAVRPPAGPFAGVPFLMKDVGARQAGLPYFAGNRALRDAGYRAPADTPLGARFRAAGLLTLGKTNTPEFGLQSTTQPAAFGPTRNPWARDRSAGGSSGGACAAVAAGLVPVAHASDGAGSIRIPAAWCGLVGLKPSRGRIVRPPSRASRTAVEFAVARSLRDTAALLDALCGGLPDDRSALPPPERPFVEALGREPGRLRIGLLTRTPGAATHPECVAAAEAAARLMEGLGHDVEPAWPEALFEIEERALHGLVFGPLEYRECLEELAQMLGRPVGADDVEPFLWELARLGRDEPVSPEQLERSVAWLEDWAARVAGWWDGGFDLLLSPTVAEPPVPLAELDGNRLRPAELLDRMGPHMAFTEPFNVTGQPAITLPLHWTPEGLPVGVQLVAPLAGEELLLSAAAQLEAAGPGRFGDRMPPLHA